jgi:hypothetical protein
MKNEMFDIQLPTLSTGWHVPGSGELCAMELVAFMERLPHSDKPACTCPVISEYVRRLNDFMPSEQRNSLLPYLPRLVDTVSPEHEIERATYIAMYAVNVFAVIRCEGTIPERFIVAMREAKTLKMAFYAAADTVAASAEAATAAAIDGACAGAAGAAATAANAAACASDYVWKKALEGLEGLLAIGPKSEVVWNPQRAKEALEYVE